MSSCCAWKTTPFATIWDPNYPRPGNKNKKAKEKNKKSSKVTQSANLWKAITGEKMEDDQNLLIDVSALQVRRMASPSLEGNGAGSNMKDESAPGIPGIPRADGKPDHAYTKRVSMASKIINIKQSLEEALAESLESYEIDPLLAVRPRGEPPPN